MVWTVTPRYWGFPQVGGKYNLHFRPLDWREPPRT
jgi:hypothetical protein